MPLEENTHPAPAGSPVPAGAPRRASPPATPPPVVALLIAGLSLLFAPALPSSAHSSIGPFAAPPLAAQEVRGTVVEGGSAEPLAGAFVSLVPVGADSAVASALSGPAGAFVLQTLRSGRYRLRVERIGYETWTSAPFAAGRGRTVARRLSVPVRPVTLVGLAVEVDSRCEARPGGAARLGRAWEEARKALEVARWTEGEAASQELRRWTRTLDPETERIREEEVRRGVKRSWRSFVSAPAEELVREGWARREGDGWRYFAPDAEVLLSETFAAGHCFRLAEEGAGAGAEGGGPLLGIRFEPAGTPERVDVEGVLWLDAGTAELRSVEFSYVGRELPLEEHPGGGRVEFARLPTGHWFVRRWRLRIPVVGLRQGLAVRRSAGGLFRPTEEQVLAAVREVGGEVERVRLPDGETVALGERGAVAGTVRGEDGTPAVGAEVRLAGTGHATRAGPEGRFRLELVAPGRYTAAARHPEAPIFGLPPAEAAVAVGAEETARVALTLPPPEATLARRCLEAAEAGAAGEGRGRPAESGLVAGVVRAAGTGEPVAGARVWLVRSGLRLRDFHYGARVEEDWDRLVVETDSAGAYLACGVAGEEGLVVQAETGEAASDTTHVPAPAPGRLARLDLEVSSSKRPAAALGIGEEGARALAAAGSPAEERTGAAALYGTVRSAADGVPVAGARVRLLPAAAGGGDREPAVGADSGAGQEVMTSGDGEFLFRDLEPGPYRIVTERLGSASDTVPVPVTGGAVQVAVLTLETRPVPLPALHVEVERTVRNPRLAGFYERKQRGLGDFITREDLERGDLVSNFRRLPNVRVDPCTLEGETFVNCRTVSIGRGGELGGVPRCDAPTVYLDGARLGSLLNFENRNLPPPVRRTLLLSNGFERLRETPRHMIEGIEVHRGGTAPAQYSGSDAGCGVVLVWTRGR